MDKILHRLQGGIIEAFISKEELEQLYTEGNIQFLDKNKRLIKLTVEEPTPKPPVKVWCKTCNTDSTLCKDKLKHGWSVKWEQ